MKHIYKELKDNLKRIDFSELWHGFHPFDFAIYGKEYAVYKDEVIPVPKAFFGNTAIEFDNRIVSIWNVESDAPMDSEFFAANMVHEMFHAYQRECGEMRFPDDVALACSDHDLEYYLMQSAQIHYLTSSTHLDRICAIRNAIFQSEQQKDRNEWKAETIEGMAEYMRLQALGQLSAEKQSQAIAICKKQCAKSQICLDSRRLAYYTGPLLMLLAKHEGVEFYHDIGNEAKTVFEIIAEQVETTSATAVISHSKTSTWQNRLNHLYEKRKQTVSVLCAKGKPKVEGNFKIIGYDPMNMWYIYPTLYSNSIFILMDENGNTIELYGETLLFCSSQDPRNVTAYIN